MPFTEQDAIDMENATILLQQKRQQEAETQFDADMGIATTWYDTLGINIQGATTRTQAQINFDEIESLLQTETDRFRLNVLGTKLVEANEKVKAVKKVNPNS